MKPFPTATKVTEFLRQLTGKAPVLKPAKPGSFGNAGLPAFAGFYTLDGEPQPDAVILVDLGVALGLAGAFMMTPPAIILENLKGKQCNEMIPPTLYEILNVSASLLNASGAAHVRLTQMIQFNGKPTGALAQLYSQATQRLELEAAIAPCPASFFSIARI
jgi:hypothetical protein